jgi:DNA-binding CsgD family transcriptional regulator
MQNGDPAERRVTRPLTTRQKQVLDLVVQGQENREIAHRLGISEQVAKDHVSVLLRRFGVPNRAALARAAVELRIFGSMTTAEIGWLNYLFLDAPVGIAVVRGPTYTYAIVNPAYRRAIGGRDVIGKTVADAFPDSPQGPFIALLDKVYATGEAIYEFEYQNRWDRRGVGVEEGWVNQWLQPIRDEEGAVTGVIIFVDDATDQIRARRPAPKARRRSHESAKAAAHRRS